MYQQVTKKEKKPRQRSEYRTFTKRKRDQLEALYNANVKVKEIARILGYTQTSIYRELQRGFYMHRNSDWTETRRYSADKAQLQANINMTAKGAPLKIGNDHKFAEFVESMILSGYSPEAILSEIKNRKLEFKTKICRVTLYSYIEKGVFLHVSNKDLLRKGKKKITKSNEKRSKKLPDPRHSIEFRPLEICLRNTFGHWEMDSVIGTNKKGETLLVMTERLTRMEIIIKSAGKTARDTVRALNRIERKLGFRNFKDIFKTITFDNGTEFSDTQGIEISPYTRKQRTRIFYCHPFCSSERGSNENQNAFIRRFVPKGTRIEKYSEEYINHVQQFINSYPRGIFDGESSQKKFHLELKKLNLEKFFTFFHCTY